MTSQPMDRWSDGSAYEAFMGRWSRPLAETFVRWLAPPEGQHWLEVGTGTGALAAAICRAANPASLVACDPSDAFVRLASSRLRDARVRFEVAGAGELPGRHEGYDMVVSGLVLNFVPDAREAVGEQLSLLRPGGHVAAYVWDYAEGMEFLRFFWDAVAAVDPSAVVHDEGVRFPICTPDALRDVLESCGAQHVRTSELRVPTVFRDFEDYWRPFVGGPGPAPGYVAELSPEGCDELVSELQRRLVRQEGAPIELSARAWVVVGERGGGA